MRTSSRKVPKVSVRCAAANDDSEDDGDAAKFGSFSSKEPKAPKRPRTSQREEGDGGASSKEKKEKSIRRGEEEKSPPKEKKEKEFAWMESDSEDDAKASGEQDKVSQVADDEATLENLDAVQSFGKMMLLSDSLQDKLKSGAFGGGEVAAACRALGRSKFFDGDILEQLGAILRKLIPGDKMTVEQVTDVIMCLKELNYYKQDIFSLIAKTFKPKLAVLSTGGLPQFVLQRWLEAMRSLGHKSDLDFMQMLEVPPLPSFSPNFRIVKCAFFAKGSCQLGTSCTYAHSNSAPLSLELGDKEDGWRKRSVMMTHDQKYVFKEKDNPCAGNAQGQRLAMMKEKDTWNQTVGKGTQSAMHAAHSSTWDLASVRPVGFTSAPPEMREQLAQRAMQHAIQSQQSREGSGSDAQRWQLTILQKAAAERESMRQDEASSSGQQ